MITITQIVDDDQDVQAAFFLILPGKKFKAMTSTKKPDTPIPMEAPPVQGQPEVSPPVEAATPGIPAEDPVIKPEESPEISPYDFSPPGEGLFPEIFEPI